MMGPKRMTVEEYIQNGGETSDDVLLVNGGPGSGPQPGGGSGAKEDEKTGGKERPTVSPEREKRKEEMRKEEMRAKALQRKEEEDERKENKGKIPWPKEVRVAERDYLTDDDDTP